MFSRLPLVGKESKQAHLNLRTIPHSRHDARAHDCCSASHNTPLRRSHDVISSSSACYPPHPSVTPFF